MPDPNSTNLTDFEVKRIDFGHPLFSKYKLGKRFQTLRRDFETGELSGVMALTLSDTHTLTAPGVDASSDDAKTEITSKLISVTTTGSTERILNLPDPAKFIGELLIFAKAIATGGELRIAGAGSDIVRLEQADEGAGPHLVRAYSDGSKFYVENPDGTGAEAGGLVSMQDQTT